MQLAKRGVLDKHNVKLIGASLEAIETAEDRNKFKQAMERAGLLLPQSGYATNVAEAVALGESLGYPLVIRSSFTLGGQGSGIVHNMRQLREAARFGIAASPNGSILIEECLVGWKEFELEVMRDRADNCVIVCSIENFDPMGVHTGDSITVAPAQTLTDRCYQNMRDAALRVMRTIKVEAGGSNIQFAVHPDSGEMRIIEMNPRVSRSSALASKATGFPIAKIAALLAAGLTLDEIRNDITKKTPACFEPTLDYCVVKIPRWAFEKFRAADPRLGTRMKSVGEIMAIGRTFPEALLKGWRALETGDGVLPDPAGLADLEALRESIQTPNAERLHDLFRALAAGRSPRPCRGSPGSTPGSCTRCGASPTSIASLPSGPVATRKRRGGRGWCARPSGSGSPTATSPPAESVPSSEGPPPAALVRHPAGDEGGRYLWRRSSRPRRPYFYSTYEEESEVPASDGRAGGDHRQRTQPHRAGARVRLLLRAGRTRAESPGATRCCSSTRIRKP